MKPIDKKEFAKVVLAFAELKGKQLSLSAVDLYWSAMQHWHIEDFKLAASHLLSKCEFMPTPKDFEDLRKAGRPTAGEAWARVLDSVRKGTYRWEGGPPTINSHFAPPRDPLVTAAVEAIGGYKIIAMQDDTGLPFLERRFCDHYDAIEGREEIRESLPQIAARPDWLQVQVDAAKKLLTQT